MQRCHSLFVGLLLVSATSAQSLSGPDASPSADTSPSNAILPSHQPRTSVIRDFGHLPLSFEPNQGQAHRKVRFLTHSSDSFLSLAPSEATLKILPWMDAQHNRSPALLQSSKTLLAVAGRASAGTLRMQLVGADPHASCLQQQPLPGRVNYFVGHDPVKWHTDIPTFGKVGFHGVYPGVDVVYYGNQRRLEYDFVVAPHADPKQIQLHFEGTQGVRLNAAGDLILRMQGRELQWRKPTAYQQEKAGKRAIAARYRLKRLPNGQAGVSFALGRYDTARPLVIDPVLTYSTYLANGSPGGSAIAVDSAGSAYITGVTDTDLFQGPAFVTKLNPAGTAVVYTTTLGSAAGLGSGGAGIAVDSGGNAYIVSMASTMDYPTTPGAFKTQIMSGVSTVAVTKLNPTGNALVYSTFVGTLGGYGNAAGIAIDSSGEAYITGSTQATDFPTTSSAFQNVNKAPAYANAFVTKLNPTGTALVYSTYLGGSVDLSSNVVYSDSGRSIVIDNTGSAYVTGTTASSDFPTTPGAFQRTNLARDGYYTAFVTKLNPTGTALTYSTYLGGNHQNLGNGIAIDSGGSAYIAGQTYSDDFPVTPGAFQTTNPGNIKAFVAKLNPAGTALTYATYLRGTYGARNLQEGDSANGIAVDSSGCAYVTGMAATTDFPTTIGAFQRPQKTFSFNTAFVTKLNSTGTALLYSTLLRGSSTQPENGYGDVGYSIALDSSDNAYIAGFTDSSNFPTTPGTQQKAIMLSSFVTKLAPVPVFPDFNNDGQTDLLLQNASTGAIAAWFMQGAQGVGGATFSLTPPIDYALVGTGDFSGNGNISLVLQSRTTNQVVFWYTDGTNNAAIPGGNFLNVTPDAGWKVVGIGDFNNDGKSDLVFQNQTTGRIAVWFISGASVQGGVLLPYSPAAGWTVAGVGDFNADGFPDIAFQKQTTGQIALWYMNGTTYVGGTLLSTIPAPGWKVVGVGDYNRDGSADLLLQNQAANQSMVWYLRGGVQVGSDPLGIAPTSDWKLVGPR